MEKIESAAEGELVFVPTPGMGHLVSAVELAKLIIQRHHRISVVVLIMTFPSSSKSSTLDTFLAAQSRDNNNLHPPSRIIFVTLPPISNPPDPSSPVFLQSLITLQMPLVTEAVEGRIRAGSPALVGFVLDMFCSCMIEVADEMNVPSYIFFTSGVSLLNLLFHFGSLVEGEGVNICEEYSDPNNEFDVPGFVNRVTGSVVPAVCLDKENGSRVILERTSQFKKSKGILVNTYEELQTRGIQTLLDQVAKGRMPPIYPVGPILGLGYKSRGEALGIMEWLDNQTPSSVVLLCFGSMGTLEDAQVKEIANGVENSGHRFLWSLRKPLPHGKLWCSGEYTVFEKALPEGFVERTAERGKIIGWAPQVSVLSHPSVGGFVSHCGWNSTLESLWFGVPIATWPLYAEQQLNAFELVKELGITVEIRMDYKRDLKERTQNCTVTAEEVENGVKKLMSMDEEAKKKVKEARQKGRKALEEGGSSHKWLGRFIQDVMTTCLY